MAKRKRYGSPPEAHERMAKQSLASAKDSLQEARRRILKGDCRGGLVEIIGASVDAGNVAANERGSGKGTSSADGLYMKIGRVEAQFEKACLRKRR